MIDELAERFEALSEIEAADRTKLKVDLIVNFFIIEPPLIPAIPYGAETMDNGK